VTANILQAHTRAVLALLEADDGPPPLKVLNGFVPGDVTPPYVLLYFALRTPAGTEVPDLVSLEDTSDVLVTSAYCHSVGWDSPDAALAVAGRVRACLLGVIPVITGRVCFPILHTAGPPTSRDEKTQRALFDQIDTYEFTSLPG
jgi:hypothetical protein